MKTRYEALRESATKIFIVVFLLFSFVSQSLATFTLDPEFFGGGKLTISFPDSTTNYSSAGLRIFVQSTGRIVAAGTFTRMTADGQLPGVVVVGLTTSGSVDATYGTFEDWQSNGFTSLNDALMYADGRLLMLTRFFNVAGSSTVRAGRLSVDGLSDGVFGSNVSIGTSPGNFGTSRGSQIAVRSDGKVLVLIIDNGQYLLYRLNPDGTRDATFGVNGVIGLNFNKISTPSEAGLEMVALADGKVLITGHVPPFTFGSGSSDFFLARLTESGNWDKTFGRTGFLQVPFGAGITGRIQRATVQPDGKILLCGGIFDSDTDTWMMRFRANGRVDTSFGNGGVVRTDFLPGGIDAASSIALSPDGKIRIAGSLGSLANFLVARYSANGILEESTSFGFTPNQFASASDIALQPDGKIVVIGGTRNPNAAINGGVFAIARLIE